jgi:type IV secretory pathway TrbL component
MHAFLQFYSPKNSGFVCALSSGIMILGLMLAAPAAYAGMVGGAGAAAGAGAGAAVGAGAGGGGAGAGAGAGGGGAGALGRRNSSSPERSNVTYDLPSGYGFEHQTKVPGQAQRGAAWSPS